MRGRFQMLFRPEEYVFPQTIEETVKLLSELEDCLIVSGGVTLHELEKRDLLSNIKTLIDLKNVGLNHVRLSRTSLEIDSSVTFSSLLEHESVHERQFAALGDSLKKFTPLQVRNLATIGGAICSGIPFLDIPTVLASLDAKLVIVSSKGDREVLVRNFYHDFFQTDLTKNELLIKAVIERKSGRVGSAFLSFKRTAVDIPIINASAFVWLRSDNSCKEVSLYVGGVDNIIQRAKNFEDELVDRAIDTQTVEKVLAKLDDLVALESFNAGLEYKKHILRLIVKEVVLRANQRARENSNTVQNDDLL
jgi:CO/xanthine dehydrogenase FAD-binding subunit